jgi:O-antigen/teichoic acid export membrane protein
MTPAPKTSFLRAAMLNYGTQLASSVLSLGNVLVVARALDPSGRGQVAFLTTVALLTSGLVALGLPAATSNMAGRRPELTRGLATNAVLSGIVLGTAGIGAVALLVALVPSAGGDVPTGDLWAALAVVPVIVAQMSLQSLAVAHYGWRSMNAAWLVTPVLTVTANGLLAATGHLTVGLALGSWIAGQVLATVILTVYVLRSLGGFGRPDAAIARGTLRFGVQAHLGRVLNQGNYRLDQWIMGSIAGSAALGVYSIAVAWTEALFFLPAALSLAQVPDVTRATAQDAGRQAATVFRFATLLTIVLAIGMVIAAPLLTTTLFGADFAGAAGQIRVLAFGAFGIVGLKLLGMTLTAQGRPLLETAASAVTFVGVVGLDILLIPAHGGMGASVASLVGYSAGGVCIAVLFSRALGVRLRDLLPRGDDLAALRALLRRGTRQATAT